MRGSVGHHCIGYCAHSVLPTLLDVFFIFSLKGALTRPCSFKRNDDKILSSLNLLVQEVRDLDLVTLLPGSYSVTFHLLREENTPTITQAKARQHMLFAAEMYQTKGT